MRNLTILHRILAKKQVPLTRSIDADIAPRSTLEMNAMSFIPWTPTLVDPFITERIKWQTMRWGKIIMFCRTSEERRSACQHKWSRKRLILLIRSQLSDSCVVPSWRVMATEATKVQPCDSSASFQKSCSFLHYICGWHLSKRTGRKSRQEQRQQR